MKKILAVFLLSFLLMGADGKDSVGAAWKKIPVLTEEKALESEIHGVTVGPHDEITIDFYDGTVYLYDTNGGFLSGYKFPPCPDLSHEIFFDDDGFICLVFKSRDLYVYDRAGELSSFQTIEPEVIPQFRKNKDTHGATYKEKRGDIVKTYPNGDSELFFVGYKDPYKNNLAFFPVIIYSYIIYVKRREIYDSLKKIINNFLYGV